MGGSTKSLVATPETALDFASLRLLDQGFGYNITAAAAAQDEQQQEELIVCTGNLLPGGAHGSTEKFDNVGVVKARADDSAFLNAAGDLVKPGGRIVCSGTAGDMDSLANLLVLQGFVKVDKDSRQCYVQGIKPTWASGVSFSLKDKREKQATRAAPPAAVIELDMDDDLDDELIDEDDLLGEEDLAKPLPYDAAACGTGRKKACANCTCGRAEMENGNSEKVKIGEAELTMEQVNDPKSACGNVCGMPIQGIAAI